MAATLAVSRSSGLRLAAYFLVLVVALHLYEQWKEAQQPRRTIAMALKGRLGNQLFQVAASEYFRYAAPGKEELAVVFMRNNYSAETDLSGSVFSSLPHFDALESACPGVPEKRHATVNEVRYSCKPIEARRLRSRCTMIDGFFQCPDIAEYGRKKVMRILLDTPEFITAQSKLRKIRTQAGGWQIVSLHVRRGDYTKRFNRGLLEPLPIEYYSSSARTMPPRAVFLVFSDDLKWCKEELPAVIREATGKKGRIMFVEEENNVVSLLMMMLADHNIIANSTFSWWAAFLNQNKERKVCAPKNWFGPRGNSEVQIYPKTWIKV